MFITADVEEVQIPISETVVKFEHSLSYVIRQAGCAAVCSVLQSAHHVLWGPGRSRLGIVLSLSRSVFPPPQQFKGTFYHVDSFALLWKCYIVVQCCRPSVIQCYA